MKRKSLVLISLLLLVISLFPAAGVRAQADGPVYITREGDTLTVVAIKFGVTVQDLINANAIANPDFISSGTELIIPGLQGLSGRLTTETIPLGENMRTLAIRRAISTDQMIRLNRLVSPVEVFAGANLIIPDVEEQSMASASALLQAGESLLSAAAATAHNPWLLAELNQTDLNAANLLPGDALFTPSLAPDQSAAASSLISPLLADLQIDKLPLIQGRSVTVRAQTPAGQAPLTLRGSLAGYPLHFFPNGDDAQVALQGVYVMSPPGIYPFEVEGQLEDGRSFHFEQMVVLELGGYIQESINGVDPVTLDPANTAPENDLIANLIKPATPTRYWDGLFVVPGYDPEWITSWFGTRRSYNGSEYKYFHSGLDYGGGTGMDVKSPAAGVVVFAGPLTVRGNATVIDHGWGVYSGMWHQSEFKVKVGDVVQAGQVIGLVGGTGRVTGPHLHWEVWVNGVQVDPYDWLELTYP